MSEYEAIFKCGYCNKETPMTDEMVNQALDPKTEQPLKSICSCGHYSYNSSFRAKFKPNYKDWRMSFGASI